MKILILEANPHKDLNLDREIRELRRVIDNSSDRNKFQVKDGAAIRKDQLHDLMLNFEAEDPKDDLIIVHFCGHGTGEQGLVFENDIGSEDLLSTRAFADFFELFKNRVACVVMNACYADVQAEAINEHIKYVIGMKQSIRDDAAIAFSIGFYRALGYGRSFEDAFKFGKNAIQLAIDNSSKSRDTIAEEMRKLVAIDDVSETVIVQEHLKPVLRVNPDLPSIKARLMTKETIIVKPGQSGRLEEIELGELEDQLKFLIEKIQFLKHSERTDDLSPQGRFRLIQQIKEGEAERQQIIEKITVLKNRLQYQ